MNYRSLLRKQKPVLPGTKRFPWLPSEPYPRYVIQPLLLDSLVGRFDQRIKSAGNQQQLSVSDQAKGGLSSVIAKLKQQLSIYLAGNSTRVLFELPSRQALADWHQTILDGSLVSFRTLTNLINTVSQHPDRYLSKMTDSEGRIPLPLMGSNGHYPASLSSPAPSPAHSVSGTTFSGDTAADTAGSSAEISSNKDNLQQQQSEEFTICPTDLFSKQLLQQFTEGLQSLHDEGRAIFMTPPQLTQPYIDDVRLHLSLLLDAEQMQRLPTQVREQMAGNSSVSSAIYFLHHWVTFIPDRRLRSNHDSDRSGDVDGAEGFEYKNSSSSRVDTVAFSVDVRVHAKFNFIIYESGVTAEDREPEVYSTVSVDRQMLLTMRSNALPFNDGTIPARHRDRLEWTLYDVDNWVQLDEHWQRVFRQMQSSESSNI